MSDSNSIQLNIAAEIKEYFEIESQLKTLKRTTSLLNKRRKELAQTLTECMRENDVNHFKTDQGYLSIEEKQTAQSVNKDLIHQILLEQLEEDLAKQLAENVFKNRPKKTCTSLRVTTEDEIRRHA
ncbi:hypothetical protein GGF32_002708 [Allomyces javanicus]|nr:hypothetical protein GGF32_002708 [Allomyces javanicus]